MTLNRYSLQPDDYMLFIHIPKTAGMTFKNILRRFFPAEKVYDAQFVLNFLNTPPGEKEDYRLLIGHLPYEIIRRIPKKPLLLTFLRDPVERAVSLYEYVKKTPEHNLYSQAMTLNLVDFLTEPHIRLSQSQNIATRMVGGSFIWDPPGYKLEGNLERAKERLHNFEFIGLTEQFDKSIELLTFTFYWPDVQEYKRLNVSQGTVSYKESLSQHEIDIIKEINMLDIELYNYAMNLFEERYSCKP